MRLRAAILARSTAFRGLPQSLAFGAGVVEASSYPLSNQAAPQFGHSSQDGEHHLPARRTAVHLLREGDKLDPQSLEGF